MFEIAGGILLVIGVLTVLSAGLPSFARVPNPDPMWKMVLCMVAGYAGGGVLAVLFAAALMYWRVR